MSPAGPESEPEPDDWREPCARALPPTGSVRAFTRRSGDCQQCDAGGTARLDHIVHHLALALGGRSAASFARRLMLPVSNDTPTPRAQTRHSGLRGLDSSRDRRLGMATQPALRDNHLRSRTSQNDRVAPRLRTQRPGSVGRQHSQARHYNEGDREDSESAGGSATAA